MSRATRFFTADEVSIPSARKLAPSQQLRQSVAPAADAVVEGKVFEVLTGIGLAHLKTSSGQIYGLNRNTPGVDFDEIHSGQRVKCYVTKKFNRVLKAQLLD